MDKNSTAIFTGMKGIQGIKSKAVNQRFLGFLKQKAGPRFQGIIPFIPFIPVKYGLKLMAIQQG